MQQQSRPFPQSIGFVLIEGYALMSLAVTVDAFRAANELSGEALFDLRFFSATGGAMRSGGGGSFETAPIQAITTDLDIVFVVAGGDPFRARASSVAGGLRKLAAHGVALGGISGGSVILATLGLMKERRFTVHWQHYDTLREMSDCFLLEQSLFVIDRDRYTSAGGIGALDMVHHILASQHSSKLAKRVSEWFIQDSVKPGTAPLRGGLEGRFGIRHPQVLEAAKLMESHIADPLTMAQIAGLCDMSDRQMQRLFKSELYVTPAQFYRRLRIEKALHLIEETLVPITEVAAATGFHNTSHFAKCFRQIFGQSPREHRRRAKA